MKKALFVATVDVHINTFHLPYLKLLHDHGYEVHVVTGENGTFPNCDKKYQISIKRNPYSFSNIKAIKQLKEIVNNEKYDLIHCHTPMGGVVARLAAKKARKQGTRVIYTAHGFHFFDGAPIINWMVYYPIEKYLAKYTDTLITINKEDYNRALSKFSKRCKDIEYVPGVGIDTKRFNITMTDKEKHDYRASLGLRDDDIVLICIAELIKRKGQDMLIDVMKDVTNKKIHLLLVGKGKCLEEYKQKVNDLNLNDNVHFLGFRKDIPQLIHMSNVVVSSSKQEGLPVNIIEALACGKPVIAKRCRGVEELLEDTESSYMVDSAAEFIEKINIISVDIAFIKKNLCKAEIYEISKVLNVFTSLYGIGNV